MSETRDQLIRIFEFLKLKIKDNIQFEK